MRDEGEQDLARFLVTAGNDRKAGQRDHRVAPPVGEPGVTGDDRAQVSAPDDEGIGGADQVAHERVGVLPSLHERGAAGALALADLGGARGRPDLGGSDDRGLAEREVESEGAGAEEVFLPVEPPLALLLVLETIVPGAGGKDCCSAVVQVEARKPRIRLE